MKLGLYSSILFDYKKSNFRTLCFEIRFLSFSHRFFPLGRRLSGAIDAPFERALVLRDCAPRPLAMLQRGAFELRIALVSKLLRSGGDATRTALAARSDWREWSHIDAELVRPTKPE